MAFGECQKEMAKGKSAEEEKERWQKENMELNNPNEGLMVLGVPGLRTLH